MRLATSLIESGRFDVNEHHPDNGFTPLICAARMGHADVVSLLLDKGADQSLVNSHGFNALHVASQHAHLTTATMLVGKGGDLEATTTAGSTALHLATETGERNCPAVIRMLLEAGANANARRLGPRLKGQTWQETPLHLASSRGNVDAIRELLRAKADPRLTLTNFGDGAGGDSFSTPLEVAAQLGHAAVVCELLQQVGLRGCGGEASGVNALRLAAENQHLEIMAALTDAGVVDTGVALVGAAGGGREASVKYLLRNEPKATTLEFPYVMGGGVRNPLFGSVQGCSPRVVRLLIDAGADTTGTITTHLINLETNRPEEVKTFKPLDLAERSIREKKIGEKDATEEQLHKLEAIRRLLLQEEAVHALSWLWPHDTQPLFGRSTEGAGTQNKPTRGSPLTTMLSMLRRRSRRHGMPLPATFR